MTRAKSVDSHSGGQFPYLAVGCHPSAEGRPQCGCQVPDLTRMSSPRIYMSFPRKRESRVVGAVREPPSRKGVE